LFLLLLDDHLVSFFLPVDAFFLLRCVWVVTQAAFSIFFFFPTLVGAPLFSISSSLFFV